ncbi:MAG TPA: protein-export chaperone SecB, partial [Nitrosomonas sp.]|nr:protein-export chaperone SecB [Nitrosomonas sp.]
LVEIHQAGIFRIKNIPEKDMGSVLGVVCPNILFPYLRESVSDTVTRAGFPPVILNPVNFEAIYLQKQQANAAATVAQQSPGTEQIH